MSKKTKKTMSEQLIEDANKTVAEMAAAREAPMDKTESIVQAEGAAHNADLEKVNKPSKRKAKKAKIAKKAVAYPLELFVNKYGFMRFSNALLADLGWEAHTDINVKVTRTATGLTIERA